jgi:hypothetical protein
MLPVERWCTGSGTLKYLILSGRCNFRHLVRHARKNPSKNLSPGLLYSKDIKNGQDDKYQTSILSPLLATQYTNFQARGMVVFLESRLPCFSARGVVGTSLTTVGDIVVVLHISSNWEDSPRCLRQRDRNHGNL